MDHPASRRQSAKSRAIVHARSSSSRAMSDRRPAGSAASHDPLGGLILRPPSPRPKISDKRVNRAIVRHTCLPSPVDSHWCRFHTPEGRHSEWSPPHRERHHHIAWPTRGAQCHAAGSGGSGTGCTHHAAPAPHRLPQLMLSAPTPPQQSTSADAPPADRRHSLVSRPLEDTICRSCLPPPGQPLTPLWA